MKDESILFYAVAQGQIKDVIESGVLRWRLTEPYNKLLKACQILNLRSQEITLLNIASECEMQDSEWSEFRAMWKEAKSTGKVDWKPAADRIVKRCMREEGLNSLEESERLLQSSADPRTTLATAITRLSSLVDNGSIYNATPSFHFLEGVMGEVSGSSGLRSLDAMLGGGLWTQALIGIGFPSSHGKSTLTYTLLAGSVRQRRKCVLFTFETNTTTAVARVLSALTGVPMSDCLRRKGSTEENQALMNEGLTAMDKHFRIYDLSFNNRERMEQIIRLENPSLGVIDHIDIPEIGVQKNYSKSDPTGDMADACLQWTIKYGFTMAVNSQFSNTKQAELKKNHDLTQVDFFGSSRVFNALDFAIIGIRHWYLSNTQYIRCKKNRKTGIVDTDATLHYNPYTQSYEDEL